MKSTSLCGFLFFTILTIPQGWAQPETGLFTNEDILDLELKMDVRTVIKDVGEDRIYHPATFSFLNSDGEKISVQVKLKTRGNTRRNPEVCQFPPLWINFKKKENKGSIFEGQDKVKMVTHCKNGASYQQSLFKEYLIYKHYNQLTDKGMRTRLGRMTYIDESGKKDPLESYVVLLEHIDQVAARIRGKPSKKELYNQDQCERSSLDIMVMFQFMIGHTDWSASKQHNVKLVESEVGGKIWPVPYDFDGSGVIDAPYAMPPPSLPITDVKSRLFRGYCRPAGTYEQVGETFKGQKENIYHLYQDFELLDRKQSETQIKYFDKFYEILDDPKKMDRQINNACPLSHNHVNET